VSLYSGHAVTASVVTAFVPVSGKWKLRKTVPRATRAVTLARASASPVALRTRTRSPAATRRVRRVDLKVVGATESGRLGATRHRAAVVVLFPPPDRPTVPPVVPKTVAPDGEAADPAPPRLVSQRNRSPAAR